MGNDRGVIMAAAVDSRPRRRCELHAVDPAAYLHAALIAADRGELVLPWSFAAIARSRDLSQLSPAEPTGRGEVSRSCRDGNCCPNQRFNAGVTTRELQ